MTAPNLCCMYEAPNYFGKTVVNPSSILPKFFGFFSLVTVRSLLIAMVSLVAEHGLYSEQAYAVVAHGLTNYAGS